MRPRAARRSGRATSAKRSTARDSGLRGCFFACFGFAALAGASLPFLVFTFTASLEPDEDEDDEEDEDFEHESSELESSELESSELELESSSEESSLEESSLEESSVDDSVLASQPSLSLSSLAVVPVELQESSEVSSEVPSSAGTYTVPPLPPHPSLVATSTSPSGSPLEAPEGGTKPPELPPEGPQTSS